MGRLLAMTLLAALLLMPGMAGAAVCMVEVKSTADGYWRLIGRLDDQSQEAANLKASQGANVRFVNCVAN